MFIGYGLRDPDTLLVLRALKERYLGAAGEFWAIMADADEELTDFWRRQHKVQLISYTTRPTAAGTDHGALLDLLRRLIEAREGSAASTSRRAGSKAAPNVTENTELIRYAARLIKPEPAVRLPVHAHLLEWWEGGRVPAQFTGQRRAELVNLLEECPGSFILEGPAGSGKSFAIQTYLSRAARLLLEWCLGENSKGEPPYVPVLLDARLYQGDFGRLALTTTPAALDLQRLSTTNQVVLFLDSLDEMPAEQLDAARWRADLRAFASVLAQVHIVYGTRRRDLVGEPTLPCYSIDGLGDAVIEEALSEVGRRSESISADLLEALRTPFSLMLSRRFLGRHFEIASAPSLFGLFVSEAVERVCTSRRSKHVRDQLAALASSIIASGRETVLITDVAERFQDKRVHDKGRRVSGIERNLVDRLVEAGILTSEIDDHVRFVHRSVTEFLAAQDLVKLWRASQIRLADLLRTRRWDSAVSWAAAALTPDEALRFVREAYASDRVLAVRIARAAEVGRDRLLATVFDALAADRVGWDEEGSIAYLLEDCKISANVASHPRPLLLGDDHLAGVAAGLLVPHFSIDELHNWIDRIGRSEISYNMMNQLGPALGKALNGESLDYFQKILGETQFVPTYDTQGRENSDSVAHRHGFESVIAGLNRSARQTVMVWSRRRSAAVRGIVCDAIREFREPEEQKYLVEQMERGLPEAIFALYLALRFREMGGQAACRSALAGGLKR